MLSLFETGQVVLEKKVLNNIDGLSLFCYSLPLEPNPLQKRKQFSKSLTMMTDKSIRESSLEPLADLRRAYKFMQIHVVPSLSSIAILKNLRIYNRHGPSLVFHNSLIKENIKSLH